MSGHRCRRRKSLPAPSPPRSRPGRRFRPIRSGRRLRAASSCRAADGHFYAPVTVGARPVTMLIDTGASVVALTGADARAAGVVWNPAQLRIVAQGAGGPVRGVAVRIERMRLGAQEARGVDAVVIPEGLPVSLLGQSFLRHLEPMRIERDRMLLGA
jgi:aspartyl protease family protein